MSNERLSSGSKYYCLFDGQDSMVGLTDSNSTEVNVYDYDPEGVILNDTNAVANPFQYEGGYFESSTGLVKFGTRYYNPNLGRWTQQDPLPGSLGNPDTLNRYVYAQDDPVNMVDPSGKLEVIPEYGLLFLGLPFLTGVDIYFTGEDIAALNGGGGYFIKFLLRQAFSGLGIPGAVQDLIVAGIDAQLRELTNFSDFECGGNGAVIDESILFSPLPSYRCP